VFKQILCALILYGTGPRRSRLRDASYYGYLLFALDVNSHRAKHVDRSDRQCQRSWDSKKWDVDERPVQCESAKKGHAEQEERKADGELGAFSDRRQKWSARCSGPNLAELRIHECRQTNRRGNEGHEKAG
jgi:hypothetical protein